MIYRILVIHIIMEVRISIGSDKWYRGNQDQ